MGMHQPPSPRHTAGRAGEYKGKGGSGGKRGHKGKRGAGRWGGGTCTNVKSNHTVIRIVKPFSFAVQASNLLFAVARPCQWLGPEEVAAAAAEWAGLIVSSAEVLPHPLLEVRALQGAVKDREWLRGADCLIYIS